MKSGKTPMPRDARITTMSEGFSRVSEQDDQKTTIADRRPGLDAAHRRWLTEARGIDPDIAESLGCCSVTLQFTNKRRVNAFLTPCRLKGREVAWSARFDAGGQTMKGFVSSPDARLNLVFAEQLDEEDYLVTANDEMKHIKHESPERIIVLTEGQLDALSAGEDAKGKELKMKDLRSPEVQGMSDDQLYKVIANGKGKMPPYEKSLGADTCHKLVAYIRSLKK